MSRTSIIVQISIYLLKPIDGWPMRRLISRLKIAVHTAFTLIADRVADNWRRVIIAEDRKTMLKNTRIGRTFGIVSVTFMYGSGHVLLFATQYYSIIRNQNGESFIPLRMLRMIPNEHHEADVKYVLEQSHIVLRLLAIWPLTDRQPNTIERIANITLTIIYYFLLHCEMVLGMFYYLLVDDEARVKAKIMAPFLYSIMSVGKYSTLIAHERGVRSCLRHIKKDWTMMIVDDAREVMMVKVTTGRRIFTVCCIFMYGAGITYTTIVPISRGSVITDQNVTIRPLPFPGHLVYFDVQNSPVYEIVYLLQFLCGLVMYTITVTICGLAALFVMHACAQVEILMRLMENFVDDCKVEQKNINAKLAVIIEHEIRIRNFLRLVEETMCYSNLVEILGCTTIICLVGYCAIVELEEQNVMALCSLIISIISNTLNIFILCFIGEYITTQMQKLSLTFGTINWYRLPTSTVRNMVLVTAALSIPPQFTAGKFIDLSFKTFGDVIKSALIYLNMLRQLT